MPEEPFPITAMRLSLQSADSSQAPVCKMGPWKFLIPGIADFKGVLESFSQNQEVEHVWCYILLSSTSSDQDVTLILKHTILGIYCEVR